MAKFVVAGRSDCPYFARVELLGDRLAKNLKKFKLHKIMVQPEDWDNWLKSTCQEKGWEFSKSPIVWRELIDRGGKGVLIGGANEFQEYVKAYYEFESDMNSFDMRTISGENKITKDHLDEEDRVCRALSKPLHVCITNPKHPICYHLLSMISAGDILGPKTEMTIRMLIDDEEDRNVVKGMAMEAQDLAHSLLRDIRVCNSAHEAFENCSIIILLDEVVQQENEVPKDYLTRSKEYFGRLGVIMNDKALKTCKVLVSGKGPINFNAKEIIKCTPNLARQNIVAVPTIVENHAKSVIGQRLSVNPAGVVNLVVWGNINSCRHIDLRNCQVHNYDGAVWGPYWYSVDSVEMVHDNKWIAKDFPGEVAMREEKVSGTLQRSTCLSGANAIAMLLKYWWLGSPSGQYFSLGVYSEGWYGVPKGLVYSFPVMMDPKGYWHVVQDIEICATVKEGIQKAVTDCINEIKIQLGESLEVPVVKEGEGSAVDQSQAEGASPVTGTEVSDAASSKMEAEAEQTTAGEEGAGQEGAGQEEAKGEATPVQSETPQAGADGGEADKTENAAAVAMEEGEQEVKEEAPAEE